MAITITKEPTGIYPAYNDSFIEFSSDLVDNIIALITVDPVLIFPNAFVIYPDADGIYTFNLKEMVKVVFNANGFKDSNFFDDAYFKSISGLYLSQDIEIEVFSAIADESTLETYEFYKSVRQVGEPIHDNPFQLLSYSPDGLNHKMTYFEGFPFHFDIQRVLTGKDLTVKNLNTGVTSGIMASTADGAFRMNVDRSNGENWTLDNILPLITGVNRLEIYEDAVFKSNLLLTKKKKCSGLYLKWFNRNGGFSHFLFNQFFNQNVSGSNVGIVGNNEFNNIEDMIGSFRSTGKEASRTFIIKAKYNQDEYENLKDIFISPLIQIYTSFHANVKGVFIDVNVEGTFSHNNKRQFNDIILTVDLPGMITAKL